jgi:hypothetical protein
MMTPNRNPIPMNSEDSPIELFNPDLRWQRARYHQNGEPQAMLRNRVSNRAILCEDDEGSSSS